MSISISKNSCPMKRISNINELFFSLGSTLFHEAIKVRVLEMLAKCVLKSCSEMLVRASFNVV